MYLFVIGVEIFVIGIIKKIKSPCFCTRLIANKNNRHLNDCIQFNRIKTQLSSLSIRNSPWAAVVDKVVAGAVGNEL